MRPDPLLDAIFQPGEESLRPALAAARRRRIRRVLVPTVASAACLAVTVQFLLSPQPEPTLVTSPSPVLQTISSRPLLPREVVRTSATTVEVVSTRAASAAPSVIEDSELLASYDSGRAALVGAGETLRLIEF